MMCRKRASWYGWSGAGLRRDENNLRFLTRLYDFPGSGLSQQVTPTLSLKPTFEDVPRYSPVRAAAWQARLV